ncbi:MAG: hypothetical protein IIB56_03225 [Planctomycetes bacterium]|nr:hypothetical protein [Planctomycetota bacterium]MCH8118120.1 hypothetical protein [Planctomycetota bacterium]
MQRQQKLATIISELKSHAPFTLFGASTGIVCMLLFKNLEHETSYRMFYVFHPAHVVLSAMVTATIFQLHTKRPKFIVVLLVGFFGSIGIATLSDSLIPHLGELLLGMHVNIHSHEHTGFAEQAHVGFIEGWYLVIPAAIAGVLIAYFRPKTKFPHAGHVLLSMWASSFHMLMAMGGQLSTWRLVSSFGFLFLAVWLPCCISDIIFPLLFVKSPADSLYVHH